jgi:hypothetical protein
MSRSSDDAGSQTANAITGCHAAGISRSSRHRDSPTPSEASVAEPLAETYEGFGGGGGGCGALAFPVEQRWEEG